MIRLATRADLPALMGLAAALTQEMATLAPQTIQPAASDAEDFAAYLDDPASAVFVNVAGATITGFARVVTATTSTEATSVFHRFAYLIDLYVAPTARRQGHGQQLLTAIQDWGQALQLDFIQLNVLAANDAARAFYARHDFVASWLTLQRPL